MSKTVDWSILNTIWNKESQIIAVWVFGSSKAGIINSGSDIDLGFYFNSSITIEDQLNIIDQLHTLLQHDKIDFIVLNDANPYLRFEAISGNLLFCRDQSEMARFVSLSAREYEDELAQWQKSLQYSQS